MPSGILAPCEIAVEFNSFTTVHSVHAHANIRFTWPADVRERDFISHAGFHFFTHLLLTHFIPVYPWDDER